jgi:hypothetical protein
MEFHASWLNMVEPANASIGASTERFIRQPLRSDDLQEVQVASRLNSRQLH